MYRLILMVVFLIAGCTTVPIENSRVSIMTFNVENLFDTTHDEGKNDYSYLPLSTKSDPEHIKRCKEIEVEHWRNQCLYWDWNDRIVTQKLSRIASAIRQIQEGPDIIVFQEIENRGVLERLRQDYLSDLNYLPSVLLEGNDDRGIDVAFLSKLPLVGEAELHDIVFREISEEREADTRGILKATFSLPDNTLLTGFAVHFPAPYHPTELREDAYNTLNQLLESLPGDRLAFAAGDFNTTSTEDQAKKMLRRFVEGDWHVAHQSCLNCRGTHYYGPADNWSFLDMILLSRNFGVSSDDSWWFDRSSVRLVNDSPYQVTSEGTPARFQLPEPSGLSDHWPLAATIRHGAQ
ncbi:MAG: endonuclease/exonuclease/phosphatase family protein [Pseudomonadota bacterium]